MTWNFFARYLFSTRTGSIVKIISRITIVGMTIGVCAWILVASVMNGFNETINTRLLNVEPHLQVQVASDQDLEFEKKKMEILLEKKGFPYESIVSSEQQDLIIRTYDGLFGGAVLKSQTPASLGDFLRRVDESNRAGKLESSTLEAAPFSPELWELDKNEVVVGLDLARSLGIFEGDPILLLPPETLLLPRGEAPSYIKVTVKALISTRLAEVDSQFIYRNSKWTKDALAKSMGLTKNLEIRLKNPYKSDDLEELLTPMGYLVTTWKERNKALFYSLALERWSMTLFLGLTTLITCFSIVSVLLLLLSQKRQDIGILMTMGASLKKIQRIFVGVGLLLSLLGLGGGIALGVLFSWLLDRYPLEILPDIYYDAIIPSQLQFPQILAILVFSIVIALVASWFPVKWDIKHSAAENLRKF